MSDTVRQNDLAHAQPLAKHSLLPSVAAPPLCLTPQASIMAESMTFPLLKVNEIVSCSDELRVPIQTADLKTPQVCIRALPCAKPLLRVWSVTERRWGLGPRLLLRGHPRPA